MTERPILFSAPMVRALLAGTKTQTRRAIKPQPVGNADVQFRVAAAVTLDGGKQLRCPYGRPGDRLWCRETCRADELQPSGLGGVRYLADDAFVEIENSEEAADRWCDLAAYGMKKSGPLECRKVPSIHMPRWASRITLEITSVRVERLNDISEADAYAEGVQYCDRMEGCHIEDGKHFHAEDPTETYASLWESINGPGSWAANPWVWCVSFRRVTP